MIKPPPIKDVTFDRFGKFSQRWVEWFLSIYNDLLSQQRTFNNTVIVRDPSDLQDIDSTKNYMIDGAVDMGTAQIIVPETGISLSGLNGARDTAKLISSADNYEMFISPSGGYSGNVTLESCSIEVTGTNSKVFNLDNDSNGSALDIVGVNFNNCTSLGDLTDYRQLLFDNIGFIFIDDGLRFNGTWTGIAVTTSIVVGFPAAALFKRGTGFAVGNVRSDINFLSVNAASVLFDFQTADITTKGGFSLTNVRTIATNAIPNIPSSSVYARIRNCIGIKNTYVGGQWYISSTAATPLNGVAISTPLKLAGTTNYRDMQWFSNTTNNAFVYDGDQVIDVEVKGNISLSGTNGDVINIYIRQWDDSASSYIDLSETAGSTMNASGRAEGIAFNGIGTISNNDRIELWVENDSAARDVTALLNGYVILSERAA